MVDSLITTTGPVVTSVPGLLRGRVTGTPNTDSDTEEDGLTDTGKGKTRDGKTTT